MDYIKQTDSLLNSIVDLRRSLENYGISLSILLNRSGTDFSDEIAQIKRKIAEKQDEIDMITLVIGQLEPDDQELIKLWYYDRLTKKEIARQLHYSSAHSVYNRRAIALKHFFDIYPW